jgi:hypothetical protein
MENGGVPEELDVEEAAQTQVGAPNPALDGPTAVGQIVRRPAPETLPPKPEPMTMKSKSKWSLRGTLDSSSLGSRFLAIVVFTT